MNILTEQDRKIIANAHTAGNIVYWYVAKFMREGSLEDAEWMFLDNSLVWC